MSYDLEAALYACAATQHGARTYQAYLRAHLCFFKLENSDAVLLNWSGRLF
jgi:hypothetical protein